MYQVNYWTKEQGCQVLEANVVPRPNLMVSFTFSCILASWPR